MTLRAVFLATPVLALGLACSSMGGSRGGQTTASTSGDATTSGHASAQTVMGRVSEATGDQLVIETSDGRRETLSVHQQTAVTIDGQVGRAADLQPGQMVRASYEEQAGQKSAITIQAGHHMGGSMGTGSPHGHAGDTGTSGSGTYQAPGTTSGTAAGDTGAAKPQAGDTGTGAEDDTYQAPGSTGTGTTGSSGTGSSSDTSTKQAGDTGTGAEQDTYQQPGSDSTGSSGTSGGSSTGGKW